MNKYALYTLMLAGADRGWGCVPKNLTLVNSGCDALLYPDNNGQLCLLAPCKSIPIKKQKRRKISYKKYQACTISFSQILWLNGQACKVITSWPIDSIREMSTTHPFLDIAYNYCYSRGISHPLIAVTSDITLVDRPILTENEMITYSDNTHPRYSKASIIHSIWEDVYAAHFAKQNTIREWSKCNPNVRLIYGIDIEADCDGTNYYELLKDNCINTQQSTYNTKKFKKSMHDIKDSCKNIDKNDNTCEYDIVYIFTCANVVSEFD